MWTTFLLSLAGVNIFYPVLSTELNGGLQHCGNPINGVEFYCYNKENLLEQECFGCASHKFFGCDTHIVFTSAVIFL